MRISILILTVLDTDDRIQWINFLRSSSDPGQLPTTTTTAAWIVAHGVDITANLKTEDGKGPAKVFQGRRTNKRSEEFLIDLSLVIDRLINIDRTSALYTQESLATSKLAFT